jgi:hypothetical protein
MQARVRIATKRGTKDVSLDDLWELRAKGRKRRTNGKRRAKWGR